MMDDAFVDRTNFCHAHPDLFDDILGVQTQRACQDGNLVCIRRYPMGLLSLAKLKAMFHLAQKLVGGRQLLEVAPADVLLVMEFLERKERSTRSQPAFFSAVNALQTLYKKLDIANAAGVELHVEFIGKGSHAFAATCDAIPGLKGCFNGGEVHIG